MLGYLFTERGLRRVTASGDQRNGASTRVMEKLGMRREGDMRQSRFADWAWRDAYLCAGLGAQWCHAYELTSGWRFGHLRRGFQ